MCFYYKVALGQERRFRAGRAGCNPACVNGGTCSRVDGKTGSSFRCSCLLGLFGATCGKIVNFCKTQSDGRTAAGKPCGSDPQVSSCAPTVAGAAGIFSVANPTAALATQRITLAGYGCFQNDQTATCVVSDGAPAGVFLYTCTTQDDHHYVYGY